MVGLSGHLQGKDKNINVVFSETCIFWFSYAVNHLVTPQVNLVLSPGLGTASLGNLKCRECLRFTKRKIQIQRSFVKLLHVFKFLFNIWSVLWCL